MSQNKYKATISANGQLECGQELVNLRPGDLLELTINGLSILGDNDNQTLLGRKKDFLACSHQLALVHLKTQPDGKCHLNYEILA